ncbi:MAG: hypothetical protein ACXQTI_05900 [Candidatus Nezhaarchaeales archaeon]
MKEIRFWDKEWETKSIKELEEEQSRRLRWIVKRLGRSPPIELNLRRRALSRMTLKELKILENSPLPTKEIS